MTSVWQHESDYFFELVMKNDLLIPPNDYYKLHTGIRMLPIDDFFAVVTTTSAAIEEPVIAPAMADGLSELVVGLLNRDEGVLAVEEGDVIARVYFLGGEKRKVCLHAA